MPKGSRLYCLRYLRKFSTELKEFVGGASSIADWLLARTCIVFIFLYSPCCRTKDSRTWNRSPNTQTTYTEFIKHTYLAWNTHEMSKPPGLLSWIHPGEEGLDQLRLHLLDFLFCSKDYLPVLVFECVKSCVLQESACTTQRCRRFSG